jgi:hypothetical protein
MSDDWVLLCLSNNFFTVPTLRFHILYIFVILNHSRRQVVHFAVTAHPTMAWVIQQHHYQLEKRYFRQDGSLVWGHLTVSLTGVPESVMSSTIATTSGGVSLNPIAPERPRQWASRDLSEMGNGRERTVRCKSCGSDKRSKFTAEIAMF